MDEKTPYPFEERFWAKVDRDGPVVDPELGPCWVWLGGRQPRGYGLFTVGYRHPHFAASTPEGLPRTPTRPAHRVAYVLVIGEIPYGYTLDHLCNNPSCVNPRHLEPTTASENSRRGWNEERREAHIRRHTKH